MKRYAIILTTVLAPILAGCGGSTTGGSVLSVSNAALSGYEVSGLTITAVTGETNSADNSFTVDDLEGVYDSSDPATWEITQGASSFEFLVEGDVVGLFQVDDTHVGLVGVLTPAPGDLSGEATYSGQSVALINDGTYIWDLSGTSSAMISFDGGESTLTVTDLNGTRTDLSAVTIDVTDVGSLTFDELSVVAGAITGSSAELISGQIASVLTDSAAIELLGHVYGTDGTAIGAVFAIDDSAAGTITATGGAIAE